MTIKPRSRVVAALLSFAAFGAGHLYVGRLPRFLMVLSAVVAAILAIGAVGAGSTVTGFLLIVTLILGLWLFGIVDSVRIARALPLEKVPWYAQWYWCVAWIVLVAFARWGFAHFREPVLGFNTFRIATVRMEPVLHQGEMILVDARAYRHAAPRIGDIVAIRHENGTEYVRYVSGIDGQSVEFSAFDASVPKFHAPSDEIIGVATVIWFSKDLDRVGRRISE